ncbi:glycosyltransferase family 4 protein [Chlamydiota bacterium]
MKIAVICNLPPPFGGAEVFAKELALHVSMAGIDLFVVAQKLFEIQLNENSSVLEYPYQPEQQRDFIAQNVRIYPFFITSFKKERKKGIDEHAIETLEKLFSLEKPDLVHCHFTTTKAQEVLHVCRRFNIPSIITLHGMTNLVPLHDSYECVGMTAKRTVYLLRFYTHVVVVSSQMSAYCNRNGLHNVTYISNGIDTEFFSLTKHNNPKGILYVGKCNSHKGLKESIRAFLNIENDITENLHLVGRGINRNTFDIMGFFLCEQERKKTAKLIDRGRICLLGELSQFDLRRLYRTSKVLVLPSLTEGFPLVILEALASGTPVIASDVGEISKVVRHGENGYIIPKGDSDLLGKAILKICTECQYELHKVCRNSVRDYNIHRTAAEYTNLFEDILKKGTKYDQNCGYIR